MSDDEDERSLLSMRLSRGSPPTSTVAEKLRQFGRGPNVASSSDVLG